jgi:hypothetical protein
MMSDDKDDKPKQSDMFPDYTRSRRDDPKTSKMAAKSIMPTLNERQRKVHEYMKGCPKGQTEWEVEEAFGWHGSTWRTRMSELGEMGLLVIVGEKYGKRRRIPQSHDPRAERDIWMCPEFVDPYWREPLPENPPPPASTETNAHYDNQGRFIHNKCAVEGCTASPGHSVGFFPREGKLGLWYCKEHWLEVKTG